MPEIKFYRHDPLPMKMHKVKIVQKLNLLIRITLNKWFGKINYNHDKYIAP